MLTLFSFRFVLGLLLAIPLPALASSLDANSMFQAFSACDSGLFSEISRQANEFAAVTPIDRSNDRIAHIAVVDRQNDQQNRTRFRQTIDVNGVKLSGFFDEIIGSDPEEHYLYWGFFSPSSPSEVASHLAPLIANNDRFVPVGNNFARLEQHIDGQWRAVGSPSLFQGKVSKKIERVLIVEKSDAIDFPGTRISCSLQGPISRKLLSELRPDISESYIKAIYADARLGISDETLRQSLDLMLNKTYLRPRFNTLDCKTACKTFQISGVISVQ